MKGRKIDKTIATKQCYSSKTAHSLEWICSLQCACRGPHHFTQSKSLSHRVTLMPVVAGIGFSVSNRIAASLSQREFIYLASSISHLVYLLFSIGILISKPSKNIAHRRGAACMYTCSKLMLYAYLAIGYLYNISIVATCWTTSPRV